MNDNAELLKFAVENIEEWPEEWTHLRSDIGNNCFFTSDSCVWEIRMGWCSDCPEEDVDYANYKRFSTCRSQVVSRNEWEEARKESVKTNTFTKSMLEAGKHVVVTGDGKERRVTKDRLVDYNDRYILLGDLDDNMSSIYPELSVVKVIEVTRTTIWSREDEEKVKEREILKEEIDSLKSQLKEKEGELRCKTQYLGELK